MLRKDICQDNLPWLQPLQARLEGLLAEDKLPQSLLIHGRAGTGRRDLALWLARQLLGADPLRRVAAKDGGEAGHPDLCVVEPLEDPNKPGTYKQSIGIDQIREDLIAGFLRFTSHAGGSRVVLVWPAEKMTLEAANCLLKSLEEPPAGVVFVLVAESLGRLPKTVISRCQHLRVPPPPAELALQWLEQQVSGVAWENLLDFAGGAPLAALDLQNTDFAAAANRFADDLAMLQQKTVHPAEVAARWGKNPDLALRWLYWKLYRRAVQVVSVDSQTLRPSADPIAALHACERQMGEIRELRRVINGGINAELSMASLLTDWYGGLRG